MNTKQLQKHHEEAAELLEAMDIHQRREKCIRESLNGMGGMIQSVRASFAADLSKERQTLRMIEERYKTVCLAIVEEMEGCMVKVFETV